MRSTRFTNFCTCWIQSGNDEKRFWQASLLHRSESKNSTKFRQTFSNFAILFSKCTYILRSFSKIHQFWRNISVVVFLFMFSSFWKMCVLNFRMFYGNIKRSFSNVLRFRNEICWIFQKIVFEKENKI